ncbi:MAG: heme-binding protein [Tateyamaria sp.]|jgi:hypothetical protein|nr:heme-binding protein [Tateyamaria sp.]MBT6266522.1 heme-binding protein [Tateyamaria sp.]MBT6341906.1 heme-binding protein [Tateyamaria sp.]MBT7446991.1 heme-binding protein [Tateyamaria sp.]MBT7801960.1 heme-binding protein [Tateyamaria sp.]
MSQLFFSNILKIMMSEKRQYKQLATLVVFLINFGACAAMAYEEPEYDVVQKKPDYEVRYYGDRLVAQTDQTGSSSSAFRRLFNYISGANTTSIKVEMTAPVTQSEKIEMTVPVTFENKMMRFFLPASYTIGTAPRPTDPSVELATVKGGYYAVRTYSGRASDRNFKSNSVKLLADLEKHQVSVTGQPVRATYNGPLTPFFMRRNEAMIRIEWE